mgnify:CR=1 FL=1
MPEETDYKLYPDFHSEERVRYYSGQFLSTQDFVDEQRYILDRLRRALDGITAHGVAKGLAASSPANGKLRPTPGSAYVRSRLPRPTPSAKPVSFLQALAETFPRPTAS